MLRDITPAMDNDKTRDSTGVPGYFVWNAGKSVTVHLNLDVVDRLSSVVLTGFGAIPRRGAEVGGILLGTVDGSIVKVEDFVPVPCEHRRGPSFLLSEADTEAFQEAFDQVRPAPGRTPYAIGYYRSNTRDEKILGEEDRKLCARYFPGPNNVALLIKPYAAKVSRAGFITYENGRLEDESALEFDFRRSELEGRSAPAPRPLSERSARSEPSPPPARVRGQPASVVAQSPQATAPARVFRQPEPVRPPVEAEPEYAVTTQPRAARGRTWLWILLSFVFLALGVVLGFQAAFTLYPRGGSQSEDPYSLNLAVTRSDENLLLKWDRHAQAIRTAQRAVLDIADGSAPVRKVDLDGIQLQNGSVSYRFVNKKVTFRLEVFAHDRVSVTEVVEWKE